MSTENRTYAVVRQHVEGKLHDLIAVTLALSLGMYVVDGCQVTAESEDGYDPEAYLQGMILEEKTSEDGTYTDFMLTVGGPTVWLRSTTTDDAWMLMGNSAGLDEPIIYPITDDGHADVVEMLNALLWDRDEV